MSEEKALTVFRPEQIDNPTFKAQLAKAIPNTLSADRMVRLALTMLKKNERLSKCTPLSVMACVIEIAQLGLEPEGVLGHAYMVPFKDQCTLIVGYRGFMHLMYQSGVITEISAEIVRKGDSFQRVLGTQRQLIHVPQAIPENDDAKNWIGAYAACSFLNNATAFEYLEKVKIYQARARSRGYQQYMKGEAQSTPWVSDEEEMWKKTPIRRLAKRMPMSTSDKRPQLLRAVMLDEYGEKPGLLIPTLAGFEVNPDPPEQPNGEPIKPTVETPVESSPKKGKPASSAAVPKAQIPKADDPFITVEDQTKIYSVAVSNGWKVPEEVRAYLKKTFGNDSVKALRRSQLPTVFKAMESGT
jgi:recombination protein RecT